MNIGPGDLDDPRIVALLDTHLARARAVTPRANAHALDTAGLRAPRISFHAAWDGETLLGVGALAEVEHDHGEIKSMHTAEALRGRGVGTAMLHHLIGLARARGFRRVSLETGSMEYFAPARALYERHGFAYCDAFGGYPASPHNQFMTLAIDEEPSDVAQ